MPEPLARPYLPISRPGVLYRRSGRRGMRGSGNRYAPRPGDRGWSCRSPLWNDRSAASIDCGLNRHIRVDGKSSEGTKRRYHFDWSGPRYRESFVTARSAVRGDLRGRGSPGRLSAQQGQSHPTCCRPRIKVDQFPAAPSAEEVLRCFVVSLPLSPPSPPQEAPSPPEESQSWPWVASSRLRRSR